MSSQARLNRAQILEVKQFKVVFYLADSNSYLKKYQFSGL